MGLEVPLLQCGDVPDEVRGAGQPVDALQWSGSESCGVHEARVEVTDLLVRRAGRAAPGSAVLDDRAQVLLGLVGHHLERAVAAPVGWI